MNPKLDLSCKQSSASFGARLLKRCLMLCFVVALSLAVSPANAKCSICNGDTVVDNKSILTAKEQIIQWIKQVAETAGKYSGIINLFGAVDNAFGLGLTTMQEQYEKEQAIDMSMEQVKFRTEAKLHDERTKSDYILKTIQSEATIASENVAPDMKTNLLCYTINARQMTLVMQQFSDLVSRYVLSGFVSDRTGNGPLYAARDRAMTCGTINENDPATGHGLDGRSAACTGALNVPLTPDKNFTFEDAGMSVLSLTLGESIITMPPIVNKQQKLPDGSFQTVSVPQAAKNKPQQQLWISARDYCYRMMGPRPTPPQGKQANTPDGQAKAAMHGNCTALQMRYMKMCSDRIGYMTRPNCNIDIFKPFCKAAQNACMAALAHGVVLPESYENCQNGLSLYEVEAITHMFCTTEGRQLGAVAMGASPTTLAAEGTDCTETQALWEAKKRKEEEAFTKAMRGAAELSSCWRGL